LREGLRGLADVEVIDTSEPNYTPTGERIVQLIHEGIARLNANRNQ